MSAALTWARSVDIPTLEAKIKEYSERLLEARERDRDVLHDLLGDLRAVHRQRTTN